eukprot:9787432-Alexandrium_andersonii.AAC.1
MMREHARTQRERRTRAESAERSSESFGRTRSPALACSRIAAVAAPAATAELPHRSQGASLGKWLP